MKVQKVQIVKSADGKIEVRGLLPGQQLVKMPDGKLQIYHQQLLPQSISVQQQPRAQPPFPLCSLPDTAFEKVLLFLPYDTIAKLRGVNKRFDTTCRSILNKGFLIAQRSVSNSRQHAKSKLPRRDSDRPSHPMWNNYRILMDIDHEIIFIDIKFDKFIKDHLCCFFPGRVLDEVFTILRAVRDEETATRPNSILRELRDAIHMAREYLDETIAPGLLREQALVSIPVKFPTEGGASLDKCGNRPDADILESKEAIRACSRRVSKLTKQKKQMKMQLKNVTMQMKQQNIRFKEILKQQNAYLKTTVKQQKSNFVATMNQQNEDFKTTIKQQKENFEATMENMNLKIVQLDRKVKSQEEVIAKEQAALGDNVKDSTMNGPMKLLSETGISTNSKLIMIKNEPADEIMDEIDLDASQNKEERSEEETGGPLGINIKVFYKN